MNALAQTPLRTGRLMLRAFRATDADALFALFSNTRVSRYLSHPAWTSLALAHERIARDLDAADAADHIRFAIERVDDGKVIGECSLFKISPPNRRAELGYALAAEAWGRGYANEALVALLGLGFSALELNRVEADIDPRNGASARALERLGFRMEGRLRERWIVAGEVSDTALYGLLASEWKSRGPAPLPPR